MSFDMLAGVLSMGRAFEEIPDHSPVAEVTQPFRGNPEQSRDLSVRHESSSGKERIQARRHRGRDQSWYKR
jgi:hypothetical protein